jgi:hypothetical protein
MHDEMFNDVLAVVILMATILKIGYRYTGTSLTPSNRVAVQKLTLT